MIMLSWTIAGADSRIDYLQGIILRRINNCIYVQLAVFWGDSRMDDSSETAKMDQ